MDGLKLDNWKQKFEQEVKSLQTEYNSYFLKHKLEDVYSIKMDESNEWEMQVNEQVPGEIKSRIEQLSLTAKPEDSI